MKRQLIITADDFGFSKERNDGVMEAFGNGVAQSASLLLNCTGSADAVRKAKNTGLTLGLHLNLTEGTPVGETDYETLTSSGIFRGKQGLRESLKKGEIERSEIEAEVECQIKHFVDLVGEKPAYVDGHQHIHLHPGVATDFAAALKKHGIPVTRLQTEANLESKTWLDPESRAMMNMFVDEASQATPVLQDFQIRASDCFTGLTTMGANMTIERLQGNILEAFETANVKQCQAVVTCELMTHPGHPTPREYGGFSWGTDDFGHSSDRIHEITTLSSDAMKEFFEKNNIALVSHRELH